MKTRKGTTGRAVATPVMAPTKARGRAKKNISGDATVKVTTSSPSATVKQAVTPPSSSRNSPRSRSLRAEAATETKSLKGAKISARNKTTAKVVVVSGATPIVPLHKNSTTKDAIKSPATTTRTNRKLKRLDTTPVTATREKLRKGLLKTPSLHVEIDKDQSKIHKNTLSSTTEKAVTKKASTKLTQIHNNVQSPSVENTVTKKTNRSVGLVISESKRKSTNSMKSPSLGRNSSRVTTVSSSTPLGSSLGNISSFSDIVETASPIIRTRKPNQKYADFALPTNSFLTKVLLKNMEPDNPAVLDRDTQSNTPVVNKSCAITLEKNTEKSPNMSSKKGAHKRTSSSLVLSEKEQSISNSKEKSPSMTKKQTQLPQKSNRLVSRRRNQTAKANKSKSDNSSPKIEGVKTRVNRKPNPKYSPPVSPMLNSSKASPSTSKSSRSKSTLPKANKRGAKSTKAVTIKDPNMPKKNPPHSKNGAVTTTIDKASVSVTESDKSHQGKPEIPVPTTPVKLSQCSIQLAVFTSPPPGAPGEVTGPIPLAQPRLTKREQLALALRRSKLSDSADTTRLNTTSTAINTETAKKPAATKVNQKGKVAGVNSALSGISNTSFVRNTSQVKKAPVWAKVSPMKNKSLTKRHLGQMYNLSFTSEENAPTKSKPKKRTKSKIIKKKPRPTYTKSKLLTTDPEFNKAFPSMFSTQSFYSSSTGNQSSRAVSQNKKNYDNSEARHGGPSPELIDDDDDDAHMGEVEMFDDHYDELPQENSTENFVPPSYETASSFVSNPTNFNVPDIVISAAAVARTSIPSAPTSSVAATTTRPNQQSTNNKNYAQVNKESNNNSSNIANNKSIPTPAATRIMSKLVGGTSTPFNEPVRNPAFNVDNQNPAFDIGPARTSSPPPPPATVSEQIQVCFGFDESEIEEDDDADEMSLNLSPVRRMTNVSGLPHHISTMSSMLSNTGAVKETAPTRFLPVRAMGAPSFSSFSSSRTANNNTLGVSKTALVQKTKKTTTTSVVSGNKTAQPTQQTDAGANPVSSPTSVPSVIQAKQNDVFVTKRKAVSSKATASKSPTADAPAAADEGTAAAPPPATVNFDESQLFDDAPVESPAKNTDSPPSSPHEANDPQHPCLPVATPEKSFSKPPRKSYDRRSMDESRRMLLESLAGGAPNSGDEDADQEDLSQVVTRRKKKPLTNSTERRLQQQKSKAADGSSRRQATKRTASALIPVADPDTSQEEDDTSPPATKRVKPILKAGAKKAASARTKQTKLKVVKMNTPRVEEGDDASVRKGGDASGDSTASSSGIFSLSSKTKKTSKGVAREQTVNDWASDVNSHFSEIEDCELVLA